MTATLSAIPASICRERRSSTPGTPRPSSRPIPTFASRSRRTTPRLVSRKIIAACDKLDGLEDGLTANLAACQKAFDFDSLVCAPGANSGLPAQGQGRGAQDELRRPQKLEGRGPLFRLAGRRRRRHGQLAAVEDRKPDPALGSLPDHRDDGRVLPPIYLHHPASRGRRFDRCADEVAARVRFRLATRRKSTRGRTPSPSRRWNS